MQVRTVTIHGFMSYPSPPIKTVTLPPTGLVLVTGLNGSGKSTLLETVSYAGWGKTLRGTDPKRADQPGGVAFTTGVGMQVARAWNKHGKVNLSISHTEADKDFAFENNTKAQEHISAVLGEWDTWRRSCAFSATDDLSFATASDAERKRLLESLLGLGRFDMALDRCRVDLKAAKGGVNQLQQKLTSLYAARDAMNESLASLEQVVASAAPQANLAGLRARLTALEATREIAEQRAREEEKLMFNARDQKARWEAMVNRLQGDINRLKVDGNCPTCDQAWPDQDHRVAARVSIEKQLEELQHSEPKTPDKNHYRHAVESRTASREAIATLKAELVAAERALKRYEEAKTLYEDALLKQLDQDDLIINVKDALTKAEQEVAHLDVTESVLGVRGARAHMLATSLEGLEIIANEWLDRIARVDAPLRLKLHPYTERKTGGTSDAISLEVEGAGGGHGYKGASGGEQRRIDVALMLALAQVSQMSNGINVASTLFFDEVFDALDAPGRESVADVVHDLATDRAVVVISHSPELIEQLQPVMRIHVEAGTMQIS